MHPNSQTPEEDAIGSGNSWTARFDIGWTADEAATRELKNKSESFKNDTIDFGNSWTARFGVGWTADNAATRESKGKSKSFKEDTIGSGNSWTARFGVGWTAFAGPTEVTDVDDSPPKEDEHRHRRRRTAGCDVSLAGGTATPRHEDERNTQRQSSDGDLPGHKDRSPARASAERPAEADVEQLVSDAMRMVTEIEQGGRQLQELAEQKWGAEQSRELAPQLIRGLTNRLETIQELMLANFRTSEDLATRASRAEDDCRRAYEDVDKAELERERLASKAWKIAQYASAKEREMEELEKSAQEEVQELRERLRKSEADNHRLETQMQKARMKEEEHKKTVKDMEDELNARQDRVNELNRDIAIMRPQPG